MIATSTEHLKHFPWTDHTVYVVSITISLFYRNWSLLLLDADTQPECDRAALFLPGMVVDDKYLPLSGVGDGAKRVKQPTNKTITVTLFLPVNKTLEIMCQYSGNSIACSWFHHSYTTKLCTYTYKPSPRKPLLLLLVLCSAISSSFLKMRM